MSRCATKCARCHCKLTGGSHTEQDCIGALILARDVFRDQVLKHPAKLKAMREKTIEECFEAANKEPVALSMVAAMELGQRRPFAEDEILRRALARISALSKPPARDVK